LAQLFLTLLEVLGSLRLRRLLLDLLAGPGGLLLSAAGVLGRHHPHPARFARHTCSVKIRPYKPGPTMPPQLLQRTGTTSMIPGPGAFHPVRSALPGVPRYRLSFPTTP